MKFFFATLLTSVTLYVQGQDVVLKYYDINWMETSPENAIFSGRFERQGSNYACTTYWKKSGNIRGISTYKDTTFTKPIGLQRLFYINGAIQDSSIYDADSKLVEAWHFYSNKKLEVHYSTITGDAPVTEAFDENGGRIKDYVYFKEAEFKGGAKAWQSYLQKSVTKDFTLPKNVPEGPIQVRVQFIVDENGNVIRPKVVQSSGVKVVDQDALRVIASSPPWQNAILYNKPIKAYRAQPLSYELRPASKQK